MFDLRNPIKIFVANGEVRYGPKVDHGFFPVFSVDTAVIAKLLVETWPWVCTDSLSSYGKRLEEAHRVDCIGSNKFVGIPTIASERPITEQLQHNPLVDAIMNSAK
jgi:hypothetical protein